jgi:integrase
MTDIILKQGARILFPEDYQKLRDQMPEYYQRICDAMLLSGMRPIEFERYDPSWYRGSRRVLQLPEDSCLKQKCKFKARTIRLSLAGCDAFDKLTPEILKKRPKRVAFRDALLRYAKLAELGTEGITPKMFRKTLVSWLVSCWPEKSLHIQASMGHDADTIVNNYLGLGFTREQNEQIRTKYLNEWGELV